MLYLGGLFDPVGFPEGHFCVLGWSKCLLFDSIRIAVVWLALCVFVFVWLTIWEPYFGQLGESCTSPKWVMFIVRAALSTQSNRCIYVVLYTTIYKVLYTYNTLYTCIIHVYITILGT